MTSRSREGQTVKELPSWHEDEPWMLPVQHAQGRSKRVRYLIPSCTWFNQAAQRAEKAPAPLPFLALAAVFSWDPFHLYRQSFWLSCQIKKEREREWKKMFDLYWCAVWKVKCDSNMLGRGVGGAMQRQRTNYSRVETDKASLVKDIVHFWHLGALIQPGYLL